MNLSFNAIWLINVSRSVTRYIQVTMQHDSYLTKAGFFLWQRRSGMICLELATKANLPSVFFIAAAALCLLLPLLLLLPWWGAEAYHLGTDSSHCLTWWATMGKHDAWWLIGIWVVILWLLAEVSLSICRLHCEGWLQPWCIISYSIKEIKDTHVYIIIIKINNTLTTHKNKLYNAWNFETHYSNPLDCSKAPTKNIKRPLQPLWQLLNQMSVNQHPLP